MTQHTTRTSRRKARKRAAALNDGIVTTRSLVIDTSSAGWEPRACSTKPP